jgi:prepilin-type N-terminal cleavage/methylation domain-containing protein
LRLPREAHRSATGFTLVELLTVIVIILVLAALVAGLFDQIRARVERANCTSNLRNLHAALQSYVVQQGSWPQCPHKIGEDAFDIWWVKEFEKMGVAEKQWKCPSLTRAQGSSDPGIGEQAKGQKPKKQIHYIPTQFDSNPISPRRWPTQPWLIEIGNLHGDGPLIIFPDGAVISLNQFQRQGR